VHLAQCGVLVSDVAQAEGDTDAIEIIAGEGQVFGIALRDRRGVTCVEKAVKSASFPPSEGLNTPYPFQLK